MTQTDRIYLHLESGRTITPLTALRRYGCMRLAARVRELREDGMPIETTIRKRKGKHFASYRMA